MRINYAKKDQNKLFESEIWDYNKQNLAVELNILTMSSTFIWLHVIALNITCFELLKYSSIRKFTTYGVVLKIPEDKN